MKKLTFITLIVFAMLFNSCYNTGDTRSYSVNLQLNNKTYSVKKVWLNQIEYMYVIYPEGDTLAVLPDQVSYHHSKTTTTVVKLN